MSEPRADAGTRWTRTACASHRRLLSRGSRWKPAVYLLEAGEGAPGPPGGRPAILKDCAAAPWPSRWCARLLLRRELRALRRLQGLDGFPRVLGAPDGDAFLTEVAAGRPLLAEEFARAPRAIADDLQERIAAMHARGVFHLDLRQQRNLLVDDALRVSVIDFGAAWAPWAPLRWLLGPLLARIDRSAALKYLFRHAPEQATREEARAFLRTARLRRLWRFRRYRPQGEEDAARRRLAEE